MDRRCVRIAAHKLWRKRDLKSPDEAIKEHDILLVRQFSVGAQIDIAAIGGDYPDVLRRSRKHQRKTEKIISNGPRIPRKLVVLDGLYERRISDRKVTDDEITEVRRKQSKTRRIEENRIRLIRKERASERRSLDTMFNPDGTYNIGKWKKRMGY